MSEPCDFCGSTERIKCVLSYHPGGQIGLLRRFCSLSCVRAWLIGKISEEEAKGGEG